MEKYVVLNKADFDDFIAKLAKERKVVAPVAKGYDKYAFEEVTTGDEVALKYIPTILSPKKYFLPQHEKIQEYNKSELSWTAVIEYEELVLFGVHTCDLAGIQCLNLVFTTPPKDINYIIRKDAITIIGLECNDYCDEYASCTMVDNHMPKGGYDLFFTELDDCFMVHVNTLTGDKLIEETSLFTQATEDHLAQLQQVRAKKSEIFKSEVNSEFRDLKPIFEGAFESKVWEDIGNRCLSCGNCTNICPTCYCFDVEDDINLDMNTGERVRVWDSCQNEAFATVAGNENFRENRGDRQRHRYMRKFNYPVAKYRRYFCTGCGRCSRNCMAKINLKETVNALIEDAK